MQTKLVSREAQELAEIVVNAAVAIAEKREEGMKVDLDNVKVEKKPGGSLADTTLIKGIVLDMRSFTLACRNVWTVPR
jgi:chaperonin GroEL (HSP60 family)